MIGDTVVCKDEVEGTHRYMSPSLKNAYFN